MQGRVAGKVALITGAARGQGRSHAMRLAEEGADIIAIDLCAQVESVLYPMARPDDLAETVRAVKATGRRIVAANVDVRDFEALAAAVTAGASELGGLDIVCGNAGITSISQGAESLSEQTWGDVIDINLTGMWHTAKAAIPHMKAFGRGGCIVLIGSVAGLRGFGNIAHYVAAKHGVVGLTRSLAIELAPHLIRVNSVHPTTVRTEMFLNDQMRALFVPEMAEPDEETFVARANDNNLLPVPWVEPVDISNALLFLSSDEGRYITGVALPVDAGATLR
jgi:(+)-trans-carveol dehydrogenase